MTRDGLVGVGSAGDGRAAVVSVAGEQSVHLEEREDRLGRDGVAGLVGMVVGGMRPEILGAPSPECVEQIESRDADPRGLLKDLKKLLKYSRIG